ncbi:stemmadenine O-acetyltransferase-like [Gastrolobium bilobum]|uniref:stemmadenine O-acetyltransferase-like n=1 Tax=Gastrolobium bilobum TaxID=150636 RepID=UPI002AAF420B|nr:stemmadenine O-acetyltransferase-like [Gastrolobium bilobum]
MKVEVELISKQVIKPSSPTPNHLRHYKLSLLDQLTPQLNNSMVYFYAHESMSITDDPSNHLKKSLSQALSYYYPLAGRHVDNTFVECNDEGVPYLEAKVSYCKLNDVLENPIPSEVSKLLPFAMDEIVDTLLGVQLNVFDCGGIAIGICMSHKIGDALSFFGFIQSWTTIARGEARDHEGIKTRFISATLFPPRDMSWYDPNKIIPKDENIVSKRFVFDATVIDALKAKYEDMMALQKTPSRVEVLSTFIWTRFMATTQVASKGHRSYVVAHTVNLRSRMDPPLPAYAFGNYYRAATMFPLLDYKGECCDLVRNLRVEIKKIDNDYILKLQEGIEYLNSLREDFKRLAKNEEKEIVPFTFTALCRFPVYDADFGWGKPTWVGPPAWKVKNVAIFIDTKLGGGIEAYISMTEEDMVEFQNDKELLAHISK